MKTNGPGRLAAAAVAALVLFGAASLAQQPGTEGDARPGASLEDAARSLRKGVRQATEAVRASFTEIREDVQGMGVAARIYGRLHWDKALADAEIEVHVQEGVATLTGSVASPAAKSKAETLARDTVGVKSVDDQLSIAKPTAPADPATTTTTPKSTTRP